MKKLLTFFCLAALLLPVLLTGCGSGGEQARPSPSGSTR